jgi:hypothetical protein
VREAAFQSKLLKALRSHPALRDAVIVKLNDRFTRGLPDIMICLHGVTTFFELKKWPETPTKIQSYFLQRMAPNSWVLTFDRGMATFMYSGAKGNQFILRNESLAQTVSAVVARCK